MSAVTRPLRWQDLSAVASLEQLLHPDDPWSVATWWAELAERPRRDYVVRVESEQLVGYAGLDLAGDSADVMTVAVDPQRQGQGHGDALMEHLHSRAARAGCDTVLLEVREDNRAARGLYGRHGYVLVHRRRGYYQPSGVDALVLRRSLGAEAEEGHDV
jgi:[ribosomal protein S18]-alanine N-acetyltransferase